MDDAQQNRSHLFTVRLWLEPTGDQQKEVRGKVRHVLSGETRYFRDGATLFNLLSRMADEVQSTTGEEQSSPTECKQ